MEEKKKCYCCTGDLIKGHLYPKTEMSMDSVIKYGLPSNDLFYASLELSEKNVDERFRCEGNQS